MTLGIITDCIHFKTKDGRVVTENHILLRQLEELSTYFTRTMICCPVKPIESSTVFTEYTKEAIQFVELPNVGGNTLKDKAQLLLTLPVWINAFKKIDAFSTIVYQRFPNNLNIPGFLYFYFKRKKVFATYTGTWADYKNEPATYRLQRWLLSRIFRGPVWVYTNGATNNNRILPGISPSYSFEEWQQEEEQVNNRIKKIVEQGINVYKLITVGSLIDYKNQLGILKACKILLQHQFPFYLTVVGDGPMREELKKFITQNNLDSHVKMVGKKNQEAMRAVYRESDFIVQAPLSEGFGKVPIEGFFHGVIPIINNIAMAANMMGKEERGFLFDATDPQNLANTILKLPAKMSQFTAMIAAGRQYAKSHTLEAWAEDYFCTIKTYFDKP